MTTTPSLTEVHGVPYGADMRLDTNHTGMPSEFYGLGDVSLAHATNEYVPLDEVVAVIKTIAITALRWCSGHLEGARK